MVKRVSDEDLIALMFRYPYASRRFLAHELKVSHSLITYRLRRLSYDILNEFKLYVKPEIYGFKTALIFTRCEIPSAFTSLRINLKEGKIYEIYASTMESLKRIINTYGEMWIINDSKLSKIDLTDDYLLLFTMATHPEFINGKTERFRSLSEVTNSYMTKIRKKTIKLICEGLISRVPIVIPRKVGMKVYVVWKSNTDIKEKIRPILWLNKYSYMGYSNREISNKEDMIFAVLSYDVVSLIPRFKKVF
ncbi:hypothetical protein [Acidianus sp. RZ1]|uniref:hypothetical protein n=1 Tax=Acidianus sp. RZ1 TaxID=1540082 RepID=UPI001492DC17|nr:hypothetical protein [Acidianus sp. RZ1]NON61559.1 hypothetical protein [Acidianus sp. RZ1]